MSVRQRLLMSRSKSRPAEGHGTRDARSDRYDCWDNPLSLVFYNPRGREGAEEEANELHEGLKAGGFSVNKRIWTTKNGLRQLITETVRGMERCSLLFVCIMSHGRAEVLRTSEGDGDSAMIINDILHQLNIQLGQRFTTNIPMVS